MLFNGTDHHMTYHLASFHNVCSCNPTHADCVSNIYCHSMPWPSYVVRAFNSIPAGGLYAATDEAMLYGPITTLLSHLFPAPNDYIVSPQWRLPHHHTAIDFTLVFIVEQDQHPVFFLEVKPAGSSLLWSARHLADQQMQSRFRDIGPILTIPTLHSVSALGPHLCFYSYLQDTRQILPVLVPADPDYVDDNGIQI